MPEEISEFKKMLKTMYPVSTSLTADHEPTVKNIYNKAGTVVGYVITISHLIAETVTEKNQLEKILFDYASTKLNPERKAFNVYSDMNSEFPSIVFIMEGNSLLS